MRMLALLIVFLVCRVQAEEKGFPKPVEPPTAVVSAEDEQRIKELIPKLGADEYTQRIEAENQLRKLGKACWKLLGEAKSESKDIQVRASAEKLLTEMCTEVWEGYYYYSLDPFGAAIEKNEQRVRFWCKVQRNENGTFTGVMDEEDNSLGTSTFKGEVDCKSGAFTFDKSYDSKSHQWRYQGKWNAEKQWVEGTYGPGSGGFILVPRKLTEEERKRYDMPADR